MGILSYGYKASKTPVGKKVVETVKNIFTGGKKSNTGEAIKSLSPAGNLSKKRAVQDDIIKTRDKTFSDYQIKDAAQKTELRAKANQPKINKKIADIYDKKAKGGRVGYKKGTPNPFARKSKLKKIQEAFKVTPSFMVKKDKPKKRLMAKKGSPDPKKKKKKFPDLTGDGKVTFADILKGRGVINGKKKKTKKKII
jgi:hypothetical protein